MAEMLNPTFFVIPCVFIVFMYLGFKKYQMRKISRQNRLRELVVENFTNLMKVSAIIVMITVATVGAAYHVM